MSVNECWVCVCVSVSMWCGAAVAVDCSYSIFEIVNDTYTNCSMQHLLLMKMLFYSSTCFCMSGFVRICPFETKSVAKPTSTSFRQCVVVITLPLVLFGRRPIFHSSSRQLFEIKCTNCAVSQFVRLRQFNCIHRKHIIHGHTTPFLERVVSMVGPTVFVCTTSV